MLLGTRSVAPTRLALFLGASCAFTAGAAGQVTDQQVPLNYNFHGMVHSVGEVANADGTSSYRSIADYGQLYYAISDRTLYEGRMALITKTAIAYAFFDTLGYGNTVPAYTVEGIPGDPAADGLDIVHLGSRCTGLGASINVYDAFADGGSIGVAPQWSVCDQTGPQTTNLSSPIVIDSTTEIGILYNSNTAGQFDVVLGFSDHAPVTVTLASIAYLNTAVADPAILANQPVSVQAKISRPGTAPANGFRAVKLIDAATIETSNSNSAFTTILEGIISVPKIINGVGTFPATPDIVGAHLTSITFQNATYPVGGRGYAIYAATVRTGTNDTNLGCEGAQFVAAGATAASLLHTPRGSSAASACGGGNDTNARWYAYTAAGSGAASSEPVYANISGAAFNATLAVYADCTGGAPIACNNPGGPSPSISWMGTASQTYYLRVAAVNSDPGATGAFTLNIFEPTPPPNLTCAQAQSVGAGDTAGSTVNSFGTTTTACGGGADTKTAWYLYTAPSNGSAEARTCTGTNFNTTLAVYSACGGSEIACDDNGCGIGSRVRWTAEASHSYYIRVGGVGGVTGNFTLHIDDPGASHSNTTFVLNYNWNAIVHGDAERTNPYLGTASLIGTINENRSNLQGFRAVGGDSSGSYATTLLAEPTFSPFSIPTSNPTGLCFNSYGPIGYNDIVYSPSRDSLVTDIVHLGDRRGIGGAGSMTFSAAGTLWPHEGGSATTSNGLYPTWLDTYDHTTPQVTNVSSYNVAFGADTKLGILYNSTNVPTGSPQKFSHFDVTLTFTDNSSVTVTLYSPSHLALDTGTNGQTPEAVAGSGVEVQRLLGSYWGMQGSDRAVPSGSGRIRVIEAVISTSSLLAKSTPFDATGKRLVSITFSNPVGYTSTANMNADISSPGASGFSIFAASVRDAAAQTCPADVAGLGGSVGADGQLTVDDIVTYLSRFFSNDIAVADLASLGGTPTPDGQLTVDDLVYFLSQFFSGCQ